MRLSSSSFLVVLSITAIGVFQACTDEGDDDDGKSGSGGAGASGGPAVGGGGASAGAAPQAGVAGTAMAGAGAGGKGGTGGAGAGGAGSGGKAGGAGAGGATAGASTGGGGASTAGSGGKAGGGGAGGGAGAPTGGSGGGANAMMNFFVTSDTAKTGNLGGIEKADMRCQSLATAVGAGSKTWKAYLSTESPMVNAKDRIGPGPYYNSKGAMLAMDKDALHARKGDADLFIDEKGNKIDGQWNAAGDNNQHDILTGTKSDGTVWTGNTCKSWTSESQDDGRGVGHSDGLGPNKSTDTNFTLWTGSHAGKCDSTQPGGGAGRIYCFVGQ